MKKKKDDKTLGLLTWAIVSAIIIGSCWSCVEKNADGSIPLNKNTKGGYSLSEYRQIVIDSCEYIEANYALAHKGNCKFCAERRKKELKEE